jgi:hypothetical protein
MEAINRLRKWIDAVSGDPITDSDLFKDLLAVVAFAEEAMKMMDEGNVFKPLLESILLGDAFIGKLAERMAKAGTAPEQVAKPMQWESVSLDDITGILKTDLPAEQTAADRVEVPYITKDGIQTERQYNPQYGDDRLCKCGHEYLRHFDLHEDDDCQDVGCKYCNCEDFVEAEASPLVDPVELLRKHQWAGTAHGNHETTAFRCPECSGIRPGDSLMFSREKLIIGNGHKPGCLLAAAIGEPVGK